MAGYKGHLVGACVVYSLAVLSFSLMAWPLFYLIQAFFSTALGALFPDIDTKSKGQKYFYFLGSVLIVVLLFKKAYCTISCLILMGILPLLVNHRGIFHNFWFCLLFVGMLLLICYCAFPGHYFFIQRNAPFFFLGLISHLIIDYKITR